jgi:hypothetical protein
MLHAGSGGDSPGGLLDPELNSNTSHIMGCLDECAPDLVQSSLEDCQFNTLKGGFRAFAFMKCNATFDDISGGITAVSAWEALVASDDIAFTPEIVGSLAAPTVTSLRVASCKPEKAVGANRSISFQDFNADITTGNFSHIAFWENKRANADKLILFAITCEGYVYRWENGTWVFASIGEVRPDNSEEPTRIEGSITISGLGLTTPVEVPGILDILP